ncbi:4F2 cell-surface antigen heavy chain [Periophthalmus magnuspinnatus]|uniref:4F2 cell-surface antigen heavy chain n=1 Tax=Periophthalmus magnuspinnatus TaxID=409849 RepID=UPI0024364D83|nr:4F2 cell-surface antigen heavy chain [Periophthalmus magnuspinnatus]
MTLNAGGPGYGSLSSPGFSNSASGTEAVPLLIPEHEPEARQGWRPLSREELEDEAGSPGWRKFRFYLVLVFWLTWVALLGTAIAILVLTPKPVAQPLKWWQKTLFYQLQPDLQLDAALERSGNLNAVYEELSYLRSLGVGALILEGLFGTDVSPVNISATVKGSATFPVIQHILQQSNKADLKVVLDFCDVDLLGPRMGGMDIEESNTLANVKDTLRFWLAQGVAGFTICDTDEAFSEKTLLEWRVVLQELNSEDECIILVKQRGDNLPPLNNSTTLVDVVIKSILPMSSHLLSGQEVSTAIETHLYRTDTSGVWTSWMVGGKASEKLKKLLLVLLMTLPGSPAVERDSDIDQKEDMDLNPATFLRVDSEPESDSPDTKKRRHVAHALFTSLSHSRAREEALLYGTFSFLPFHTSNSSNSTAPPPPPVLAFLRSWGCVHFLILLNIGPQTHALDPAWAPSLPEAGVYVASTGMDRLGATSLDTLVLQPHEAIVIKLFEAGAYS